MLSIRPPRPSDLIRPWDPSQIEVDMIRITLNKYRSQTYELFFTNKKYRMPCPKWPFLSGPMKSMFWRVFRPWARSQLGLTWQGKALTEYQPLGWLGARVINFFVNWSGWADQTPLPPPKSGSDPLVKKRALNCFGTAADNPRMVHMGECGGPTPERLAYPYC